MTQQNWSTIPEMVLSVGDRFGDSEAVVDGSLRLTFAQLVDRIRCAAGAFAEMGVDRGDRVAIWAPNSAEWMIAAFGLLTAGGVVVPVNTRFKPDEAADVITRSGAKAVLVQEGFLGLDYSAPPGVTGIDLKSGFLQSGSPFERRVDGDDVADIIYTSGTTGRPKGVMTGHRQNLRLYAEWCDLADLRQGDRYLIVNPFFHTFGYKAGCIASFIRGATMLPVPVFDIDTVVELIAAERITMLPGPPTLYHSLLAVEDKAKLAGQASPIYLAGSMNGWNPGDANFKLTAQSDMLWRIQLPQPKNGEPIEFKFARGTWDKCEVTADLSDMGNHTLPKIDVSKLKAGEIPTIEFEVLHWADERPNAKPTGEAPATVSVGSSAQASPSSRRRDSS